MGQVWVMTSLCDKYTPYLARMGQLVAIQLGVRQDPVLPAAAPAAAAAVVVLRGITCTVGQG